MKKKKKHFELLDFTSKVNSNCFMKKLKSFSKTIHINLLGNINYRLIVLATQMENY